MSLSLPRPLAASFRLAGVLLLLGAALVEVGCHDCGDLALHDVSGAALAAAGGISDADRIPGSPGDFEIALTEAACSRICPPDPGGRSLESSACVEVHADATGQWCGPSSTPAVPAGPGCVETVECSYQFAMCVTSPG